MPYSSRAMNEKSNQFDGDHNIDELLEEVLIGELERLWKIKNAPAMWRVRLYQACPNFSSCLKARCSTFEKLTLRLTAISFSHFGMVRDFRTALSKCVRAYSSTSTETMLIKRSSSP